MCGTRRPNGADADLSAMARALSLQSSSTRDSSPASSDRNAFEQDANTAGTPPATRADASHYSEADEKRLHESDGHYWPTVASLPRTPSLRQSTSPLDSKAPSPLRLRTTLNPLSPPTRLQSVPRSSPPAPSRTSEDPTQTSTSRAMALPYLLPMSQPSSTMLLPTPSPCPNIPPFLLPSMTTPPTLPPLPQRRQPRLQVSAPPLMLPLARETKPTTPT